MTKAKIEPDRILVNFLRANITDINSSRSADWIFPDFPRIQDLGDNSYPRIGVTILTESSEFLGMYDDDVLDTVTLQIDIVAKKNQLYSVTTTNESLGTMSSTVNSNRLTYTDLPNATVTNSTSGTVSHISHAGTAYSNVIEVATVSDFTSPANVGSGTVEWAVSTGDLNFDSADVTSHNGQTITSTSVTTLNGKKVCQYLARKIIRSIRANWRTDVELNGLLYPIKINNIPIQFDEDLGIFRQTIEYQFKLYNAGEGL